MTMNRMRRPALNPRPHPSPCMGRLPTLIS